MCSGPLLLQVLRALWALGLQALRQAVLGIAWPSKGGARDRRPETAARIECGIHHAWVKLSDVMCAPRWCSIGARQLVNFPVCAGVAPRLCERLVACSLCNSRSMKYLVNYCDLPHPQAKRCWGSQPEQPLLFQQVSFLWAAEVHLLRGLY